MTMVYSVLDHIRADYWFQMGFSVYGKLLKVLALSEELANLGIQLILKFLGYWWCRLV